MAPKKRAKSAAAAEAPSVVHMLRWSLRNTIEEFDDDVFVDCYGDELDMAREAAKDELEKDENDCSSVAYSTKLKANEAAAARCVDGHETVGVAADDCGSAVGHKESSVGVVFRLPVQPLLCIGHCLMCEVDGERQ